MKFLVKAGLLVYLGLMGCSEPEVADLNKYIAEVKAKPKSAIEPLPEIKVVEPFLFDGNELRDPFAPESDSAPTELISNLNGAGIHPDPLHQKEDLEQYALDSLKMVGTLRMGTTLWGLIKVQDAQSAKEGGLGAVHRVKVGNFMGTNYGKIIRITEDKIELVEIVPDKPGTWREQAQTLPLVLAE